MRCTKLGTTGNSTYEIQDCCPENGCANLAETPEKSSSYNFKIYHERIRLGLRLRDTVTHLWLADIGKSTSRSIIPQTLGNVLTSILKHRETVGKNEEKSIFFLTNTKVVLKLEKGSFSTV